MKMRLSDVHIYWQDSAQLLVVADMLCHGMEWPTTIGKYKFASNEVMEDWMIGNYSGHAKYLEIKAG